jgi:hypothetical protein
MNAKHAGDLALVWLSDDGPVRLDEQAGSIVRTLSDELVLVAMQLDFDEVMRLTREREARGD